MLEREAQRNVEVMWLTGKLAPDFRTTAKREELVRLLRENKQLRLEREILTRAAAWFARKTGSFPPGSSSSSR